MELAADPARGVTLLPYSPASGTPDRPDAAAMFRPDTANTTGRTWRGGGRGAVVLGSQTRRTCWARRRASAVGSRGAPLRSGRRAGARVFGVPVMCPNPPNTSARRGAQAAGACWEHSRVAASGPHPMKTAAFRRSASSMRGTNGRTTTTGGGRGPGSRRHLDGGLAQAVTSSARHQAHGCRTSDAVRSWPRWAPAA